VAKEDDMADNTAARGQQDRTRINVNQEHELRYWTEKFGCTADELRAAVSAVGPMAEAVEQQVKGRTGRGTR
jgi:hypothetical protein